LIGSSFDLTSIQLSLKAVKRTRVSFDAITGFHHGTVKRRRRLLLGTFCSGLACLLFLPQAIATSEVRTKPVVIKVEPKKPTCSIAPKVGELVQILADRQAGLNGNKYQVQAKTQLGGLVQLNLVRVCDKSEWKVTAWKTGKVYQIDSVG
jgi:hypothetical protein